MKRKKKEGRGEWDASEAYTFLNRGRLNDTNWKEVYEFFYEDERAIVGSTVM